MKENIETKDVQRTEYLDKNGLDMLWAKVKENTHNQVEVERNRAVAKENSIIDTKADKSALDNYVLTTALTALEQKVTANTTSIEGKQDAGKYIPYKEIEGGLTYCLQDSYNIMCQKGFSTSSNNYDFAAINYNCVKVAKGINNYILIDKGNIKINDGDYASALISSDFVSSRNGDNDFNFSLNKSGIKLLGGDDNHVLTSNASTIDITEYAKKSELPTAATKENFGVVKVGDGLNVTDGTISVDPEYLIDMMSYGVEWDTTVADPTCTRIGNPLFHKQLPIQSEYKGCLVKNGKVNYYLNPNDWSKKADGTPSVLDGTDGDVMVHIPKFYGKSGSNGNKRWVRIATTKIGSSWIEIPEMFVSAYRITTYTDADKTKVASVVNTTANYRGGKNRADYDKYLGIDKFRTDLGKPRTNVSRATMRTMATNSGQELLCYEFYKWVFYWAYVIEYANFNSQKEFNSELTSNEYHQGGLGSGVTNIEFSHWDSYNKYGPLTPCGYTNEFGNFSGVKQMVIPPAEIGGGIAVGEETESYANRWRGFENPFGDIWTNLDGIVLKRDFNDIALKVYTTTDSSKFGDDTSVMNVAGTISAKSEFIKEFDLGETGEIIPMLVDGSDYTYKCDYNYSDNTYMNTRTLVVGGNASVFSNAGLGCFNSKFAIDDAGTNDANTYVGFRSVVRA